MATRRADLRGATPVGWPSTSARSGPGPGTAGPGGTVGSRRARPGQSTFEDLDLLIVPGRRVTAEPAEQPAQGGRRSHP